MRKEWEGFVAGSWTDQIDVEEFIKLNYICINYILDFNS